MEKIRIENVVKKYNDRFVLKNINISVDKGDRISILGPSGCGKSTLLKIIAGLIDHEGSIYLNGADITKLPTNKRNIVIVDQENLLFPHLDVFENIAFGLKARNIPKKQIEERVDLLLSEISLEGYGKKKVSKLSGGEKQRVALARALAVNPEILLLDEAYSSLDTNMRVKMRDLTQRLQEKHSITTILVTHDKDEALSFSKKIAVMINGRIEQFDLTRNVYEYPKNNVVARFMFENNFISLGDKTAFIKVEDIEVIDNNKKIKLMEEIQSKLNDTKINSVRSVEIDLSDDTKINSVRSIEIDLNDDAKINHISLDNRLPLVFTGMIEEVEYRGSRYIYKIKIDSIDQNIIIERDKNEYYKVGSYITIKADNYIVYDESPTII